jgi:hypothetical protein
LNPPSFSRAAMRSFAVSNAASSDSDCARPFWNSASPKNVLSL